MTREPAAIQPPVAYLPCKLDDEGEVDEILMVQMADGTVALMGYTALDRFMACCGDAHPWVLYQTADLADLKAVKPYDAAYLDIPLPPQMRLMSPDGGS